MTLEEYIDSLIAFAVSNPETYSMQVIHSKDSEGNGFEKVHYPPSKGIFDEHEKEFIVDSEENIFEYGREKDEINAVCIN